MPGTTDHSMAGWNSDLPTFGSTEPRVVRTSLERFVPDAGEAQRASWAGWIPQLQRESRELLASDACAAEYCAILEYRLPRDARRPDVIVLENGVVVVLELKGPDSALQVGLDQVLAYARDLRCYHEECHDRPVVPVLVRPMASVDGDLVDGAWIVAPRGLHALLERLPRASTVPPLTPARFLREDAYCPLPSIVDAARDLFEHGELPYIKRARASTEPALQAITAIAREAAATRTRHLIFLQGVPGSGKTLVGLQLVHARWLDELAVREPGRKPRPAAVYLSGNQPLVQVLQHALGTGGGGGAVFVQLVKDYIEHHSKRDRIPPEHLLVFDEAQRAHDASRFAQVHHLDHIGESEPDHLLRFMERVPEWAVLVALIGTGQAIHTGEEGGLPLWRAAIERANRDAWTIHAPASTEAVFADHGIRTRWNPALSLDTEIRHHLVPRVSELVELLIEHDDAARAGRLSNDAHSGGHRFLITRSMEHARRYLHERYEEAPRARFGIVASSRCKRLASLGVDNTFQATKRLRVGPWFNAAHDDQQSCRRLSTVATEFQVQGLELDMTLLAWGTDYRRATGRWNSDLASKHRDHVRDPHALRRNAYRVLLTRGRDGTIVYVPEVTELDETWEWLRACGLRELS